MNCSRSICARVSCALLLAGSPLSGTSLPAQQPAARDSAGIRITENPARASARVAFRIGATPLLEVGGLEADPDLEFDHRQGYLRAARLSDGGLVVIDVWRVHFFDARGTRRIVTGREGAGPNEFRYLTSVCRTRGDTVVVYDSHNRRITVLAPAGNIVRAFPVDATHAMPSDACFDDGTYLLSHRLPSATGEPIATHYTRHRLDGSATGTPLTLTAPPFDMVAQSLPVIVPDGAHLAYSDATRHEVRWYDAAARLTRILRTGDALRRITAREAEERITNTVPDNVSSAQRQQMIDRMRSRPHAEHWPAHGTLRSDPSGRLWMQDHVVDANAARRWTAFDPAGRLLGRLEIPLDARGVPPEVIAFERNVVLLRHRTEDGASLLSLMPLVPAGDTRR